MARGDALVLLDHDGAVLVGDVEARDFAAQALGHELQLRAGVHQAEVVVDEEVRQDRLGVQADGLEQDRHRHLAAAVDAEVQDVLRVELEVEPRAAVRDDARAEQQLARAVRLALVVLEEHAGAAVQLADDDTLGAVDDERAVVGHERHFAHVDLLLLDLLDHLGRVRLTVVDDHLQLRAHGGGEGQAALLAFAHIEGRLGHVELDELHLHEAVVRRDREGRQERGLQPFGLALGRRHVLLQEGHVRLPLHRQQVRDVENALALAEALANPLALGEAVGGCLRHEYSVPLHMRLALDPCVVGDWRPGPLRPKLGGWPLPTAGGQPRHCTSARPNLFSAVGSENTAKPKRLCAALVAPRPSSGRRGPASPGHWRRPLDGSAAAFGGVT